MGFTQVILILILFFGQIVIASNIPDGREYATELNNIKYQLSRVADNLAGIRKELELTRQAILYISQEGHNETE